MSPEEWDALPWWQSVCYLDGLQQQGILDGKGNRAATTSGQGSGTKPPVEVDYAEEQFLPRGFQTRRAG